jgi:serine-type D-Ala-D-Ala carboxypeptidase (penicillin-binding protein 5/6)
MGPAPRFLSAIAAVAIASVAGSQLAAWPSQAAAHPAQPQAAAHPAQPTARPAHVARPAMRQKSAAPDRGTPNAGTGPTGVAAAAAELVNADSDRWIWGRATQIEHPIASITKVMTALVVIEAGSRNREIRVTKAAEEYGRAYNPGSAGLHPGDMLTTRQLLAAMLLPSGSDAAYLLAGAYGPGWPAFVRKMNATARKLGMIRTHFANFDGLPWPTEYSTYSTARDLITLAGAAMKQPVFRQIVAQRAYRIAVGSDHHHYYWKNTNLLIGRYRGAIGIKTGFTTGAGYCLLFEARRGAHDLLGVVLDSTRTNPSVRFTAAANMLNWGFAIAQPQD